MSGYNMPLGDLAEWHKHIFYSSKIVQATLLLLAPLFFFDNFPQDSPLKTEESCRKLSIVFPSVGVQFLHIGKLHEKLIKYSYYVEDQNIYSSLSVLARWLAYIAKYP